MKFIFVLVAILASVECCSGLSIIDNPRRVYSPNGQYFVCVDPDIPEKEVFNINRVRHPFWSFNYKTGYGGSIYVTDNGQCVIWVDLWFTDAEAKNDPAIIILKKGGHSFWLPHNAVSKPRKPHSDEMFGGFSESTRIWLESEKTTTRGLELQTSGSRKIIISLKDGSISG